MPYSGPDDDSLPERIKKMPANKRRAFVHAFNSAYGKGGDSRAFAIANAAANRAGAKDDGDLYWGGATSFAEMDAWIEGQRVAEAIDGTLGQFNVLMMNVSRSGEGAEQYARAQALVEELAARIEAVQADPDIAFKAAGDPVYPEVVTHGEKAGAVTQPDGTFMAYKDEAGVARWVTIHTNKFVDRDGEIFKEQAHRDYVARVDATKNYPDLQLWHTPVPIGRADVIDYDDRGFVVASGTYLPGYEDVGERLAEMAAKGEALGCSHGFQYDRLDRLDGVFEWYDTREITVLPLARAANLLTTSAPRGSKEIEMLTTEKAEFLRGALGPERFDREIEGKLDELAQKAAAEGLDFKDAAAVAEPPAAVVEAPAATPAPPAEAPPAAEAAPAVTVTSTDPSATITISGLEVGVPAAESHAPADLAAQVLGALAAQGALDPTAEPPRNEQGEEIVESGTVAADGTLIPDAEPQARTVAPEADKAADATIPEHPIAVPDPTPPPAPLDLNSNEAQVLDLLRKAMSEVIAPVMERMAAIETKQAELATDNLAIKAAQGRGMDQAIADAFRPQVGPPAVAPASAAASNAPSATEVAAIEGLKAEAAEDDGIPSHLRPYLGAMVKPIVEN